MVLTFSRRLSLLTLLMDLLDCHSVYFFALEDVPKEETVVQRLISSESLVSAGSTGFLPSLLGLYKSFD